ncbi:MAG TPA: acyl carrier protein [Ruminococcaceae bacterium]|nr:acyl carrier protein [Oscillospiraceae bacterium]
MAVQGKEQILEYASKRKQLCSDIKAMIVEQLCLDMDPEFLTDDQPLFGRGLELDSIDSLELSVGVFNKWQISLSDDDNRAFSSVNALADFIQANAEGDGGEASEAADLSGGMDLG